jgi:hypothetical protein
MWGRRGDGERVCVCRDRVCQGVQLGGLCHMLSKGSLFLVSTRGALKRSVLDACVQCYRILQWVCPLFSAGAATVPFGNDATLFTKHCISDQYFSSRCMLSYTAISDPPPEVPFLSSRGTKLSPCVVCKQGRSLCGFSLAGTSHSRASLPSA